MCACLYVRPPSFTSGATSFCACPSPQCRGACARRRLLPSVASFVLSMSRRVRLCLHAVPLELAQPLSCSLLEALGQVCGDSWQLSPTLPPLMPWAHCCRLTQRCFVFVLSTAGPLGARAGEQDRQSTRLLPSDCHQVGETRSPRNAQLWKSAVVLTPAQRC